jgi:hypothetical protein
MPASGLLYPDDTLHSFLEELRRTVPVVDRALQALTQLCGHLTFEGSESARKDVERWAHTVKVNQQQRGLHAWMEGHIDAMLMYGKGVGELVPTRARNDVYALVNVDPRSVIYKVTDDPLVLAPFQRQRLLGELVPLHAETLLVSINGGHVDRPHGIPLFRSVPFVARACRTIENATAQVWQRVGAPPFHINWEPDEGFTDPNGTLAAEVLSELKANWDTVMDAKKVDTASVVDFLTSGTVTVSVIGQDGTPLNMQEPFRLFLEQIIALTGLPSWFLGMHWSTTERLAQQQVELIIANIEAVRRQFTPQLEQVLETRLQLVGKKGRVRLKWSPITLHDMTEQARAWAWREQARQRTINNAAVMWQLGWIDQLAAAQQVDPEIKQVDRSLVSPPIIPGSGNVIVSPNDGYDS